MTIGVKRVELNMTENKRYPGKARRKAAAVQFLKQHLIAKELETSVTEENGTTAVYGRDTSFLGLSSATSMPWC
jgi:hypothetical protein